ncbi:MAG: hypothetical protein WCS94_14265 [Verrucomicrobiota bacterium]
MNNKGRAPHPVRAVFACNLPRRLRRYWQTATHLAQLGNAISKAEVLNASSLGFWLMVEYREYFLGLDAFPWFRNAAAGPLFNMEFSHGHHLY